jgi:hypothetical protein
MLQPSLLKQQKHIARGDKSVLYMKPTGEWITTCPSCGIECDVTYEKIGEDKPITCCGWTWSVFDMAFSPPKYDPRWIG